MNKLEIVSMVKVSGVWYQQEELPVDQFKGLLEVKIMDAMQNIGFIRKEPSKSIFGNLATEEEQTA